MINIRKYYLFKIKKDNLDVKKNIINSTLEELFYLNTNKINYGSHIFDDLCTSINKEKILKSLKENYELVGGYIFINNLENTIVLVKNTFIVIETTKNAPIIFKYLNSLEKNLFVCDFQNKDFFFLNEFVRLNLKISI